MEQQHETKAKKKSPKAPTTPAAKAPIVPQGPPRVIPPGEPARQIPLEQIDESPFNKRRTWGDLTDLAKSIEEVGVLEDVLARPSPGDPTRFELVFGHRRFRASKLANVDSISAKVRELTDEHVCDIIITENAQREDIHPLEEAEALEQSMKVGHKSADELAARLGKSRAHVYARLKLLALCEPVRKAFAAGDVSASVALYLARIPSAELQEKALKEVSRYEGRDPWDSHDAMSARAAQDHIESQYMLRLAEAPFDRADATLVPAAGACAGCPKRTGNQPELFADVKSADVCTDPTCFSSKKAEHNKRRLKIAAEQGQAILEGKKAVEACAYGSAFVQLDEEQWIGNKRQTWRSLTQGAGLKVTLAKTKEGEVVELVDKAAAAKLLPKAERPHVADNAKAREEQKERDRKRKAEADRKRVKTMAVTAAVVAAAEKREPTEATWRLLAELLVDAAGADTCRIVAGRRGLEVKAKGPNAGTYGLYEPALRKLAQTLDVGKVRGLIFELAFAPGTFAFGEWTSPTLGPKLVKAAGVFKVDVAKVGADALAAAKVAKAEKASKKPAAKVPAKKSAKKPAKKRASR